MLSKLRQFLDRRILGIDQNRHIIAKPRAKRFTFLTSNQVPCTIDDLFLKLAQLLSLLSALPLLLALLLLLLLLLLLICWRSITLAKDLFEMPNFGEVHIAGHGSRLTIGTDVFGEEIIRNQVIWLGTEFFHIQKMINLLPFPTPTLRLLVIRVLFLQHYLLSLLADDAVMNTERLEPEIVPRAGTELHLFDRRSLNVFSRGQEFQFRRAVGQHVKHELGRQAIFTIVLVSHHQVKLLRLFQLDICNQLFRIIGVGDQLDRIGLFGSRIINRDWNELGRSDRFVDKE